MELSAGFMVGGGVKLLRPLDAGGMGALWIGSYVATGSEVAVKFILDEVVTEEPTALDRFQREASVLGKLRNQHIVKMFEQGQLEDGTPFIVMELLQGESLVERLERLGQALSLEQVTTMISQITDALQLVHSHGVIHRDIKGENIYLLGAADQVFVKILDFGLAKTPDMPGHPKLTAPGMIIGSPEYMSPEQIISSMTVDQHADLWAVGVLAYVALTLEFPFSGAELKDVFGAIRSGRFVPPSQHRPGLPPALDGWFQRVFHMNREQRFQSAGELCEAFKQAVAGAGAGLSPALIIACAGGGLLILIIVVLILVL